MTYSQAALRNQLADIAEDLNIMLAQDPLGKPPEDWYDKVSNLLETTSEMYNGEPAAIWIDQHISTPLYGSIEPDSVDSDMLPENLRAAWDWRERSETYDHESIYRPIFDHVLRQIQHFLNPTEG